MWRPKDWNIDEIVKENTPMFHWEDSDTEFYHGIEVGADAILKALLVDGLHLEAYQTIEEVPHVAGTYVFIPDKDNT